MHSRKGNVFSSNNILGSINYVHWGFTNIFLMALLLIPSRNVMVQALSHKQLSIIFKLVIGWNIWCLITWKPSGVCTPLILMLPFVPESCSVQWYVCWCMVYSSLFPVTTWMRVAVDAEQVLCGSQACYSFKHAVCHVALLQIMGVADGTVCLLCCIIACQNRGGFFWVCFKGISKLVALVS